MHDRIEARQIQHRGHARAINVAIEQAHAVAAARQAHGDVERDGGLAHAALARAHGDDMADVGQCASVLLGRGLLEAADGCVACRGPAGSGLGRSGLRRCGARGHGCHCAKAGRVHDLARVVDVLDDEAVELGVVLLRQALDRGPAALREGFEVLLARSRARFDLDARICVADGGPQERTAAHDGRAVGAWNARERIAHRVFGQGHCLLRCRWESLSRGVAVPKFSARAGVISGR